MRRNWFACLVGFHRWRGVPTARYFPEHQYCPCCGRERWYAYWDRKWVIRGWIEDHTWQEWDRAYDLAGVEDREAAMLAYKQYRSQIPGRFHIEPATGKFISASTSCPKC